MNIMSKLIEISSQINKDNNLDFDENHLKSFKELNHSVFEFKFKVSAMLRDMMTDTMIIKKTKLEKNVFQQFFNLNGKDF